MPIYLKEVDVVAEVAKFQSALIVVCRFCPAASLAVRNDKPYIEFFRKLLNTEPYEELIDNKIVPQRWQIENSIEFADKNTASSLCAQL